MDTESLGVHMARVWRAACFPRIDGHGGTGPRESFVGRDYHAAFICCGVLDKWQVARSSRQSETGSTRELLSRLATVTDTTETTMKIEATMDLDDLAELMGSGTTELQAVGIRDMLIEQYQGQNTEDVSEADWLALLDQVV